MAPINSAVMVLSTLWLWNDFLLPLVLLSKRDDMTLQLVQYVFQSQFRTDYNLAFASYLMAMAPLIIIYTVAQKWVVSGITKGAIK
jgi:raffinose/stachyose/melibiose transport system permease protein